MTEPKEESFSGVLNNQAKEAYGWNFEPNPYAPTTEKISHDEVIQMEQIPNPSKYAGHSSVIQIEPSSVPLLSPDTPYQSQHPSGMDKLEILKDYNKFYLDYEDEEKICVISGDSPDSTNIIMKVQMVSNPRGKNQISNTSMNFLDSNSMILFRNERVQFRSQVFCDDHALGEVSGDGCGCDREFLVSSHTSDLSFNLIPQGTCSGFPFCMCNYCLMDEYFIYDARTKSKVGSITCGERIEVTLGFRGQLSTSTKALLLSSSLNIFQLYFSPCCGNVGEMGSNCICAAIGTVCPIVGFLILIVVLLVNNAFRD